MDKQLGQFIKEVPKAELHLHIEGCIQLNTLWKVYKKNKISIDGVSKKEDLAKLYEIKSLDQFINFFINVLQKCVNKVEDLEFYFLDLKDYLKRNNVRYAELFFAPSKLLHDGASYKEIAEALQKGAEMLSKEGFECLFLMDVSRSFGPENAMQNLENVLAHPQPTIIGIGLGGAERAGPAKDYQEVFEKARANKLRCVAHAGEDAGPESIWDTINLLQVERIGHATSAQSDDELCREIKERRIPLEVCITSNVFTKRFVKKAGQHPVREFYDKGLLITLNSDDPTLFGSELCDEYRVLVEECGFTGSEVVQIMKNNVVHSFMPKEAKDSMLKEIKKTAEKHHIN